MTRSASLGCLVCKSRVDLSDHMKKPGLIEVGLLYVYVYPAA